MAYYLRKIKDFYDIDSDFCIIYCPFLQQMNCQRQIFVGEKKINFPNDFPLVFPFQLPSFSISGEVSDTPTDSVIMNHITTNKSSVPALHNGNRFEIYFQFE